MSNVTNANEKSVSSINGVIKCGSTPLGLKMKYGQETFREGYTEDKKKKKKAIFSVTKMDKHSFTSENKGLHYLNSKIHFSRLERWLSSKSSCCTCLSI